MQASQWTDDAGVIDRLRARAQQHAFSQLVTLLLRELRRQGIDYQRAMREVLAFGNSLSLAFPASEIDSMRIDEQRIRITPGFTGLLGSCGTLPLHDTERLAARKVHDRDASQAELLDVLSNRLFVQWYEAWGKYRVGHGLHVRGHDALLPLLTALAGMPSRAAGPAEQLQLETAAFYAGLLRTRPIAAGTIEQVLRAYFGVPVRLEQFVGGWETTPVERRSTLGKTAPVLGSSAALGVRQWRHDMRARLHIGPLSEAQLPGFLPGGSALAALQEMVGLFAVPRMRYELRLLLAPPCIGRLTLTTRSAPRQLGWTTFLTATPGVADRPDVRLALGLATRSVQ